MKPYRYILQPYGNGKNTRFSCPSCQKKREFTRYIDTKTGHYVHESVGSCNRSSNCGYHYTPKQFFIDHPWLQDKLQTDATHMQLISNLAPTYGLQSGNPLFATRQQLITKPCNNVQQPISYMDVDTFKASRIGYEQNNFVHYLQNKLGVEATEKLIALYHIGTSKKWLGATTFWQINKKGKIRGGKIMLYDKVTGKRVQKPFSHLTWVHTVLKLSDYNLKQCLFGEHLLQQFPNKPVAVVESEKTAIICSFYLPKYIWLATGSKGNLTRERCLVLKSRNVTLFPDLDAYDDWNEGAEKMRDITSFAISDILKRIATKEQKKKGLDLADFLLKAN